MALCKGQERLHLVKTHSAVNVLKYFILFRQGPEFSFSMGCTEEAASPGSGSDYLSTQGEDVDNYATSGL